MFDMKQDCMLLFLWYLLFH